MSSNIATELKPCPHCGNQPRIIGGLIDCPTCEYPFIGKPGVLLAEMVEKWQQRASSVSVETKTGEDAGKPEPSSRCDKEFPEITDLVRIWRQAAIHLRKSYGEHITEQARQLDECADQLEIILSEHGGSSRAGGASSQTSSLTEPASGKYKMSIFEELLKEARITSSLLIQSNPIGSGLYERGIRLQLAIERAAK